MSFCWECYLDERARKTRGEPARALREAYFIVRGKGLCLDHAEVHAETEESEAR